MCAMYSRHRGFLLVVVALIAIAPTELRAQQPPAVEDSDQTELTVTPLDEGLSVATTVVVEAPAPSDAPVFVPMYGSFVLLQALDVAATRRALNRGAVETNPLIKGIAGSTLALAAVKAAQAAGTIWLTESLRKKHRTAAVVLMIGLNAGYGVVVVRNFRWAR